MRRGLPGSHHHIFGGWWLDDTKTLQKHIDEAARAITTRLAITQQFYGRKLAIYESGHQQMADLISSLADAQFNPAAKTAAVESLHNLYLAYTRNSLYLSDELVGQLQSLVSAGNDLPALHPTGKASMKDLDEQVAKIEEQMKKDLHVEELGRIPGLEH